MCKIGTTLILGLNFVQRYRVEIEWGIYGTSFLRHEGKKIATSMKMANAWTMDKSFPRKTIM